MATHDALELRHLGITPAMLAARGFVRYEEAATLVLVQTDADGRQHYLMPETASAWVAMQAASHTDGETLILVSAFRSVQRQTDIILRKLAAGLTIDDILQVSAPPGYSEHHTGRAIDIATPGSPALEEVFETTTAYRWLCENAASFGFTLSYPRNNLSGYLYEPWHWCYQGK